VVVVVVMGGGREGGRDGSAGAGVVGRMDRGEGERKWGKMGEGRGKGRGKGGERDATQWEEKISLNEATPMYVHPKTFLDQKKHPTNAMQACSLPTNASKPPHPQT
jgi:hypothetical protein